ncbi:hypothetical protein A8709_33040 [Paenibacillus pectinilyticus]|uniref:Uncharacterized protein n=1 Tax=Paenibacillus pectinilyticus TaxID=512399 RepID=A0A1C0ZX75_9BACL|nr:hypothetical protein [Paenibacillus pectinilyticus]OCT12638.1 hypothetical protein A8709_33040 [Paenibacillus pectinilyticus]
MATSQLPQLGANADFNQVKSTMIQWQDYLNWFFRNLDSLNIKHLTADKVDTGTLNAGKVTIKVDYATGASITIDSTGMTINDGTKDTFHVDIHGQVTMTGAQVQSAAGTYPRIELSSSDELLKASSDANNFIYITPDYVGGTPALVWDNPPNGSMQMFIIPDNSGDFMINTTAGKINIKSSTDDVVLQCGTGKKITVNSWNELYNVFNGQSMQTALNAKANTFSGYTGSFSTGTNTVIVSNGIITGVV